MAMEHFYALIMAGGGGTRLWPLSRRTRPKQLLPLTEDRTMFQVTVDRLSDLLPPERIFVVTGAEMVNAMHEVTPYLPIENFIVEPFGRDSGPAAGLGIYHIAKRDPQAVVAVLSADHHIAHEDTFRSVLRQAVGQAVASHHIITLGIKPSYAATGFGYIQRGALLNDAHEFPVYQAARFVEKPDQVTAESFFSSGLYSWNAGMFILRAADGLAEFARQQPQMDILLRQFVENPTALQQRWGEITKLSIDYAIMENAKNMAVIPVDFGWSDIGSWSALFDVLSDGEGGNVHRGAQGHIQIDSHGTLIVSDRMVVTIGVDDMVIVDTKDVVLVCHRDRAQDVREVVKTLKARGEESRL
jgi:mannose-1-phosphate guanylyltransferase